jgi:hypothetical protein
MEDMTDAENVLLGVASASLVAVTLQPTLYWKNAAAQGLPFTFRPSLLFRGCGTNLLKESSEMALQFAVAGRMKGMKAGGCGANLSAAAREMCGAIGGGAFGALLVTPFECVMIQQQLYGTSVLATPALIARRFGVLSGGLYRGLGIAAGRDAIYVGGMLGLTPVIRRYLVRGDTALPCPFLLCSRSPLSTGSREHFLFQAKKERLRQPPPESQPFPFCIIPFTVRLSALHAAYPSSPRHPARSRSTAEQNRSQNRHVRTSEVLICARDSQCTDECSHPPRRCRTEGYPPPRRVCVLLRWAAWRGGCCLILGTSSRRACRGTSSARGMARLGRWLSSHHAPPLLHTNKQANKRGQHEPSTKHKQYQEGLKSSEHVQGDLERKRHGRAWQVPPPSPTLPFLPALSYKTTNEGGQHEPSTKQKQYKSSEHAG